MMVKPVSELLFVLADPVVWLDTDGRPRQFNPAAQRLLPGWMLQDARHSWIGAGSSEHKDSLPRQLSWSDLSVPTLGWDVWLIQADVEGYGLLFSSTGYDTPQDPTRMATAMSLAGAEFRQGMVSLSALMQETFGKLLDSAAVNDHFLLLAKARRTWEHLEALTALSEMYVKNALDGDERIYLYSLVTRLVEDQRARRGERVRWEISPDGALVAPIYGNTQWLDKALTAHLESLAEAALAGARIHIDLRQVGGYVVLTGHLESSSPTGPAPSLGARNSGPADPQDLELLIASRILALHGAEARIKRHGGNGQMQSFVITLPSSLPQGRRPDVWCQECPAMKQSMVFARELATLSSKDANVPR